MAFKIIILAIIIVFLLGLFLVFHKRTVDTFTTARIEFLSAQQTRDFLVSDPDKYVESLTPMDLYARHVATPQDYKERISKLAVELDDNQKKLVFRLTQEIDQYLIQSNQHKLASVPWKIAVVEGNLYENGFPHTRMDIIFMSIDGIKSVDLKQTLLHEKVHLYQRLYPDEVSKYIQTNNYRPWKLRSDEPMARANPDVDGWIYIDPVSMKPMVAAYASKQPSSISDVMLLNPVYEHPYEKMAYEIAAQVPMQSI